ncbi:MAG: hypothetical protein IPP82_02855 [Xanthomonadales bacterium]|nr:hypothetical protein [Xanthomonadales bacterium]
MNQAGLSTLNPPGKFQQAIATILNAIDSACNGLHPRHRRRNGSTPHGRSRIKRKSASF